MKTNITKLIIKNFRNHEHFVLKTDKDVIFIHGRNGTGKTSILEAISLFSPGKGLLGAIPSMQCRNLEISNGGRGGASHAEHSKLTPFFIEAEVNSSITMQAESVIGTNVVKKLKVNDKPLKKQLDVLSWCDILWFNAKMQYDILSSSYCRKFFDRTTFYLYPHHVEHISDYEKVVKSRLKSLEDGVKDDLWLTSIEKQIANLSYNAAKGRVDARDVLNSYAKLMNDAMPMPCIFLDGEVEKKISQGVSKEEVVKFIMDSLKSNRQKDGVTGQTLFGIHKTKVIITNAGGLEYSAMSSGQQKLLILSFMYVVKDMVAKERKRNPIILLDEMISFLDVVNIGLFLGHLSKNSSQVWITNPEMTQMPEGLDFESVSLSS